MPGGHIGIQGGIHGGHGGRLVVVDLTSCVGRVVVCGVVTAGVVGGEGGGEGHGHVQFGQTT